VSLVVAFLDPRLVGQEKINKQDAYDLLKGSNLNIELPNFYWLGKESGRNDHFLVRKEFNEQPYKKAALYTYLEEQFKREQYALIWLFDFEKKQYFDEFNEQIKIPIKYIRLSFDSSLIDLIDNSAIEPPPASTSVESVIVNSNSNSNEGIYNKLLQNFTMNYLKAYQSQIAPWGALTFPLEKTMNDIVKKGLKIDFTKPQEQILSELKELFYRAL